ncbi:bifunctional 3-demethylubiquinone-9 3-methyltransferase/ 2-octaprenyl-6-hydroxy phenol methylase [compost metagenome]
MYYNVDYLEFLVKSVWKITKPVRVIDFGCGYGYLGLKLLPLLPEGSTYTGVDFGEKLLRKAEEIYKKLPYQAEFIQCDVNEYRSGETYDIAICHALLLHMSDPIRTLTNMINNTSNQGRIICFEPHWIANMANFHLSGTPQSSIVRLGVLQKLFEMDQAKSGRDGNIGIKIPPILVNLA